MPAVFIGGDWGLIFLRAASKKRPNTRLTSKPSPEARSTTRLAALAFIQRALADPGAASPEAILALQRAGGNRAVQRLLDGQLQRQAAVGPEGGELDPNLSRTIQSARGGGHALEPRLGSRVGQSLGADFSSVRVHTDSRADQLNHSLGANAFTYGRDIFFRQGQYNPGSTSGQRLVAHELTHVVQQGGARSNKVQPKLSVGPADDGYEREAEAVAGTAANRQPAPPLAHSAGARRIQRWPFGKKKNKKKTDTANDTYKKTGKAPDETLFIVRAAVKTQTKARGHASLQETLGGGGGHSWLEIELGPAYRRLADLEQNALDGDLIVQTMGGPSRTELEAKRVTTPGFYPDVTGAVQKGNIAKQLFKNLPGKIIEPEQASFVGTERGAKGFAITDSTKAIDLFAFVNAHRSRPYNIMRYNCTDFVIQAIKRMGYSLGNTSNAVGWTVPALLYKQIYKQAELGDESAKYTELKPGTNRAGKRYDLKHAGRKTEKRLAKKARRLGIERRSEAQARAQAEEVEPELPPILQAYGSRGFMTLRHGKMMRPGTLFGVTGRIEGDWGEVVLDLKYLDFVLLREFELALGVPYPGAERAHDGGQAEEDSRQDGGLDEDDTSPDDLAPQQLAQIQETLPEQQVNDLAEAPPEGDIEPPKEDDTPADISAYVGQVVTLTHDITIERFTYDGGHQGPQAVPAGTQVLIHKLEGKQVLVDAGRDLGRGYISPSALLAALQPV